MTKTRKAFILIAPMLFITVFIIALSKYITCLDKGTTVIIVYLLDMMWVLFCYDYLLRKG